MVRGPGLHEFFAFLGGEGRKPALARDPRPRKAQSLAKPSSNRKAQALEKALRRQERNNRP